MRQPLYKTTFRFPDKDALVDASQISDMVLDRYTPAFSDRRLYVNVRTNEMAGRLAKALATEGISFSVEPYVEPEEDE